MFRFILKIQYLIIDTSVNSKSGFEQIRLLGGLKIKMLPYQYGLIGYNMVALT